METAVDQAGGVVFDGWKIPWVRGLAVDATAVQGFDECALDHFYAAVAAHFAYEASAWAQGAPDAGDYRIRTAHPVECCVAEDGVEFVVEIQVLAVHYLRFY